MQVGFPRKGTERGKFEAGKISPIDWRVLGGGRGTVIGRQAGHAS